MKNGFKVPEKKQYTIACIIGTRPEIIKMAPVIFELQKHSWAKIVLINTAQHRKLIDDMLDVFNLKPDYDLDIMMPNQSLGELTANLCTKMESLFQTHSFDAILAQGDTTTVFVSSLIAFYHRIPFGHVEAGLRTFKKYEPFPEEINRVLTAPLANWHFTPTEMEKENLLRENIPDERILVTGNSVIDALYWVLEHKPDTGRFAHLNNIIVVTSHRRENFGDSLKNICEAIIILTKQFPHLNFVLPVHPNPNVQLIIESLLSGYEGIHLIPPIRYDEFVHLMQRAILMLTDSGGIQEEAPALKKPVLVLRNSTERPAILSAGVGRLVGTVTDNIVNAVSELLTNDKLYERMSQGGSPYGDGHTSKRIVEALKNTLLAD